MHVEEVNESLRDMISTLIQAGWTKTKIAKILLGTNGQSQIGHLINESEPSDLGLRPLTKIANLLDFEVLIAFNSTDNTVMAEKIELQNLNFISTLKETIEKYLTKTELQPIRLNRITINKDTIELLDELLDDV